MITDKQTELLYIGDSLPLKYPTFWKYFNLLLQNENVPCDFVYNTRDIWCRDYMPVQINDNCCVRFEYFPDYLLDPKYIHSLTNNKEVEIKDEFKMIDSPLIIDGGNLVCSRNFLITTDKTFTDNQHLFSESQITEKLKEMLNVKEVIIIPQMDEDYTGHADGMVRFLDDRRLIVADFSMESRAWRQKFEMAGLSEKFEIIEFPNYPSEITNANGDATAIGNYINFTQVGNKVLFPQFEIEEDQYALERAREILCPLKVIPVKCRDIAMEGGGLHCISWNVKMLKQMNLRTSIKIAEEPDYEGVKRYVYDNISFYLSFFDFDVIEESFRKAWFHFYGELAGDADLRSLTHHHIEEVLNETNLIPQKYVDKVIALIIDYLELTGHYGSGFTSN